MSPDIDVATGTPSPDPTVNPIDGSSMAGGQKAVIQAGLALYEAALYLRAANGISRAEAEKYLVDPMGAVTRQLQKQLALGALPAIEKPTPSVIQIGHDKAADFLRAANSGASIEVKQFKDGQ